MTTTIKLDERIRDRLKAQAADHGRTMSQHVESLLDEQERRDRYASLRRQMGRRPPDAAYLEDVADWQSDAWS
ncbi:MAG: hypothetical protein Q4G43_06585 [Mobilicoccus sp.]|nr:hypothetical protein [Mobilicoccus sp.]